MRCRYRHRPVCSRPPRAASSGRRATRHDTRKRGSTAPARVSPRQARSSSNWPARWRSTGNARVVIMRAAPMLVPDHVGRRHADAASHLRDQHLAIHRDVHGQSHRPLPEHRMPVIEPEGDDIGLDVREDLHAVLPGQQPARFARHLVQHVDVLAQQGGDGSAWCLVTPNVDEPMPAGACPGLRHGHEFGSAAASSLAW